MNQDGEWKPDFRQVWNKAAVYLLREVDLKRPTAQTDFAVALALIQRSREANSSSFRASLREIQEIGRIGSHNTVEAALERLQDQGFIEEVTRDRRSWAKVWHFPPRMLKRSSEILDLEGQARLTDALYIFRCVVLRTNGSIRRRNLEAATDAAERSAVGLLGLLVYEFLVYHKEPFRLAEIAERLGLAPGTVRSKLQRLKKCGLVECKQRKWEVTAVLDDRELDEHVAQRASVLGAGERRQEKHIQERQVWWGKTIKRYHDVNPIHKYVVEPCQACGELYGFHPDEVLKHCDECADPERERYQVFPVSPYPDLAAVLGVTQHNDESA
jgi:DNA-binding transcriptional ArsR family regulator